MFTLRIKLNSVFILLNYLKLLRVLCIYIIHCAYLFQSQEELQEYCRHHEITYVALVSDKEGSYVKVNNGGNLSQFNRFLKLCVNCGAHRFPLRPWPWVWVEIHYFTLPALLGLLLERVYKMKRGFESEHFLRA